jgi:hypothetical protein
VNINNLVLLAMALIASAGLVLFGLALASLRPVKLPRIPAPVQPMPVELKTPAPFDEAGFMAALDALAQRPRSVSDLTMSQLLDLVLLAGKLGDIDLPQAKRAVQTAKSLGIKAACTYMKNRGFDVDAGIALMGTVTTEAHTL